MMCLFLGIPLRMFKIAEVLMPEIRIAELKFKYRR